nr:NAD-dependent epimerase/dehydratase family protein [Pseudomonadales bacterium]
MRVLVTGSTGFVGFHVVKALKKSGHTVVALVRSADKAQQLYSKHGIVLDHLVVGSVSDNRIVREALHGCDAVVHAAAITPMQAANEQDLFATNVTGVKNVIGTACA